MEKIINYTLSSDGVFPEDSQCGGIQGEHKATAVCIIPDEEFMTKLESYIDSGKAVTVKIDAVTSSGELAYSETRTSGNLFSPFYLTDKVTSSGLDAVLVVRILVGKDGEKELCRAQIKLYFTPSPIGMPASSQKGAKQELSVAAAEIIEALEEKAKEVEENIDAKAAVVASSAKTTARHLKQSLEALEENRQTILEFTEGTTIVFSGGDATTSSEITMVVDENLSEISENPVQNKAITAGITAAVDGAKQALLGELDTTAADILAEIEGVRESVAAQTVETGTDGIWQYEKWPNGTFKCFGTLEATVSPTNEWANGHYYAPVSSVAFPEGFIGAPNLTVSVEDEGANFLATKRNTEKTGTGTIYILSLEQFTEEAQVRICLQAFGKWK